MAFAETTNPYAQMSNPYAGGGAPGGPPGGPPSGYPQDQRGAMDSTPPPGGGYPPAGGYPPQGGAPGGYPPAGGPAPGGYPPAGGPGGYPPAGGAPEGYPPAGGPGGYPPAGGAPSGYPPPGGAPGGYPPGQEDMMKGAAGGPGGFKMPNAVTNMTGQQQAMAGAAGLALAGGAAYAGNKYYQGHHQQGGQQPPPQQAAYPGQSGGGYPQAQGGGGYPQPQGGGGGGYPNHHQGGASTGAYAGGGAVTGAALGAAGAYAYQQYQGHQNPGQPQETNWQQIGIAAAAGGAGGALLGFGAGKFFNHVGTGTNRDYVIIVDRSGSMNVNDTDKDGQMCTRWDNARRAVEILAPKVTKCDRDGVTLYLFSRDFQKFEGIKDPGQVHQIFHSNRPQGSTNLAAVLNAAFGDFFRKGKPTTILVITDGEPDSEPDAQREIEQASNRLRQDADLSITFVQVGDDEGATRYLKSLDDQLRCKFDIVDTVKDEELRRLGFEKLIAKSIGD